MIFISINTLFACQPISGQDTKNIKYDHNWQEHPTAFDLGVVGTTFTTSGDTTTNIIGTDPGMTAPTLTTMLSESALTANFSLLASSPCIDKGDTTGLICDSFDNAGNTRIYGSHIDIGAFEYHPITTAIQNVPTSLAKLNIYPNPATNTLFISTTSADGIFYLQDISGRTILEQKIANTITSIDIHSIQRGIYLAVWISGTKNKHVEKIVIQ